MTAETILFIILIICALLLSGLIVILARAIVYLVPMLNGPVFVASSDVDVKTMIGLADLDKNSKIADLGSGDGKIVIALAEQGHTVDGYEINPLLVRKSREKIKAAKLTNKATIHKKSFWQADLSQYNVIMLYGTTYIMPRLKEKLQKELPKNSQIISNYFTFPNWKPTKSKNQIHLYTL